MRAVANAVSESDDLASTLLRLLGAVCQVTGWVLGGAWVQRLARLVTECSKAWFTRAEGLEPFIAASEQLRFDLDDGLPGRVRVKKAQLWLDDVTRINASCAPTWPKKSACAPATSYLSSRMERSLPY